MTGTTKSGFQFDITNDALNDWEMLDHLEEMETGKNPLAMITFAKELLGAEQYQKFKAHIKGKNGGKMPIKAASDELLEIMTFSQETKN